MSALAVSHQNRVGKLILRRLSAVASLGLVLVLGQGCERSGALKQSEAGSAAEVENLPFHQEPMANEDGATAGLLLDAKQSAKLPFRGSAQPRVLSAGTLLTVQLQESLSSARAHAGDQFSAVITSPLTAGEDILVKSGSAVKGRIEAERSQGGRSGREPGSGYFRLTLISIMVEGRPIAVQSSSLFARGTVQSKSIAVQKGRRLTFRLTDPVALGEGSSTMNSQLPSSTTR